MPRFVVKYAPQAKRDLQASYDWGVENWGRHEADGWISQIEELFKKRLSSIPFACPLAPESAAYEFELRHLVIYRYRIIFRVLDDDVFILRIRGPFSDQSLELD